MKGLVQMILIVTLISISKLNIKAQTIPVKVWDKTLGGGGGDELHSLQQTSDGGYIVGGYAYSWISGEKSQASQGSRDFWVLKLNAHGNKIWDKTYGGDDHDVLFSLNQTSDGGYILGGSSDSGLSGDKSQASRGDDDFWVVRLDANGNKLWDKTFGGSGEDVLYSLLQTLDGGYILGGYSNSGVSSEKSQASKGVEDFWVVKLDASGNKIWDKTIGGNGDDRIYALQQTTDGGYILGGTSYSMINGDKTQISQSLDYWVVKLDLNGNKIWDKTFGSTGPDALYALQQTSDGGYILGGWSDGTRFTLDFWIVKLDATGNMQWNKAFGGDHLDILHAVYQTSDGGYILGGESWSGFSGEKTQANQGFTDYWIIKLDTSGNKQWDKSFGGNNYDRLFSLQQTLDGGYILGGSSDSDTGIDKSQNSRGNVDYWVIKLGTPCERLLATLTSTCTIYGNTLVKADIAGVQADSSGNKAWILTYTVNGIIQTITDSTSSFTLAANAPIGSVFSLVRITSGKCSTTLNSSVTVEASPPPLKVVSGSNCGTGSLTLSATGVPKGGRYFWYDSPAGGNPIFSDTTGIFQTPNLAITTTYFVAARNKSGCEGSRLPVVALITELKVFAGNDEVLCNEAGPYQLAGFSPAGGTWSGNGVNVSGTFTPDQSLGSSQVLVYTFEKNGCIVSDSKQINIENCRKPFIPNIITQNQDDNNDTFQPQNLAAGKWNLQIFNRWGAKIFETEEYRNNWPEKKIISGTYYYYLKHAETGQHFKGWLEITN